MLFRAINHKRLNPALVTKFGMNGDLESPWAGIDFRTKGMRHRR